MSLANNTKADDKSSLQGIHKKSNENCVTPMAIDGHENEDDDNVITSVSLCMCVHLRSDFPCFPQHMMIFVFIRPQPPFCYFCLSLIHQLTFQYLSISFAVKFAMVSPFLCIKHIDSVFLFCLIFFHLFLIKQLYNFFLLQVLHVILSSFLPPSNPPCHYFFFPSSFKSIMSSCYTFVLRCCLWPIFALQVTEF